METSDRSALGKISKDNGKKFEQELERTFNWLSEKGICLIEKNHESMRTIKRMANGKFLATFDKKSSADYQGTLLGGQTIVIEAKYTTTDRVEQSRVLPHQAEYLDKHLKLGSRCYVIIGFDSGNIYKIPWEVWRNMKTFFGHKYVTEKDAKKYRVNRSEMGIYNIVL